MTKRDRQEIFEDDLMEDNPGFIAPLGALPIREPPIINWFRESDPDKVRYLRDLKRLLLPGGVLKLMKENGEPKFMVGTRYRLSDGTEQTRVTALTKHYYNLLMSSVFKLATPLSRSSITISGREDYERQLETIWQIMEAQSVYSYYPSSMGEIFREELEVGRSVPERGAASKEGRMDEEVMDDDLKKAMDAELASYRDQESEMMYPHGPLSFYEESDQVSLPAWSSFPKEVEQDSPLWSIPEPPTHAAPAPPAPPSIASVDYEVEDEGVAMGYEGHNLGELPTLTDEEVLSLVDSHLPNHPMNMFNQWRRRLGGSFFPFKCVNDGVKE